LLNVALSFPIGVRNEKENHIFVGTPSFLKVLYNIEGKRALVSRSDLQNAVIT